LIESRQSYCNEKRVQFFWPTLYVRVHELGVVKMTML